MNMNINRRAANMKKYVLAVFLLCGASYASSPLSLQYPLGMPVQAVTGGAAAMGGSGTAVAEEYMGVALNPANGAIGARAAFTALVAYNSTTVVDNGNSGRLTNYEPQLLSLILPVGNVGNISFAMQRRYDVNLNFFTTTEDLRDNLRETTTIELHRQGGLTAWQAGWAYRFGNGIGFGFQYERLFFKNDARNIHEAEFRYDLGTGAVTHRSSLVETINTSHSSDGIRFGMQIPVHEKVTLGAAAEYILPGKDNALTKRDYRRSDALSAPVISSSTYSVSLPPSISIGAAYRLDERWLFAADAFSVLWQRYENPHETYYVRQTGGISAGARFIPAAGRLVATYPEKMHYSAGLRYSTLPYGGGGTHDFGITLGLGLPIQGDGGQIDVAFGFGRRTDARYEGYSENTVMFQLGINGGRNWFQKDAASSY